MANKKISNATSITYNGKEFKSKLEKTIYLTLKEKGFNPEYEPTTFVLIDGFKPKTPFYDKESDGQFNKRRKNKDFSPRKLILKSGVIQSIKYTPDFYFNHNGLDVYIEVKGFENDVFYIKKKLFIKYLDSQNKQSIYFEIYTKSQLLQAIEIINKYGRSKNTEDIGMECR